MYEKKISDLNPLHYLFFLFLQESNTCDNIDQRTVLKIMNTQKINIIFYEFIFSLIILKFVKKINELLTNGIKKWKEGRMLTYLLTTEIVLEL